MFQIKSNTALFYYVFRKKIVTKTVEKSFFYFLTVINEEITPIANLQYNPVLYAF